MIGSTSDSVKKFCNVPEVAIDSKRIILFVADEWTQWNVLSLPLFVYTPSMPKNLNLLR